MFIPRSPPLNDYLKKQQAQQLTCYTQLSYVSPVLYFIWLYKIQHQPEMGQTK